MDFTQDVTNLADFLLVSDEDPEQESEGIFGTEYVYRCIITNDYRENSK